MNELQLSLLGLGLFAFILVVVYNRWVERHHHKQQQAALLDAQNAATAEQQAPDADRQEPVWDAAEQSMTDTDAAAPKESVVEEDVLSPLPDPVLPLTEAESWVDAIATLRFYEPRNAGTIRDTLSQMGITRFERVEFYTGDAWYHAADLPAQAIVSNLRARRQLASRQGPVALESLDEWIHSLESLAQLLSAGISVETTASLVERAANLDAFCVRVDALIILNLKPRGDIAEAFDRLAAQATVLRLTGAFPQYVKLGALGDVDFQVQANPSTGLVSMVLDFPRVVRPDTVVSDMLNLARTLAQALDAEIIDDAGQLLSEEGMALLVHQVVRLSAMLQAQGIEPGSSLANRLFA